MPPQPTAPQAPIQTSHEGEGSALTGFILGLVSIVAWLLPIVGLPITLCAIIFSSIGLRSSTKHGKPLTGLILGIIFLIATIVNAVWGATLAVMHIQNLKTDINLTTPIATTTSDIVSSQNQVITPPSQTATTTPIPTPIKKTTPVMTTPKTAPVPVTTNASTPASNQNLITFDDLATPDTSGTYINIGPIANGYHGLNWNNDSGNFTVGDSTDAKGPSGYQLGAVSPKNVAFCAVECVISSISPSSTFNLVSLYATAPWNDGEKLHIIGYNSSTQIYNNDYTINASSPTLLNLNYEGVSKVVFFADSGTIHPGYNHSASGISVLIDNVTVNF
jgi:hypothetical protein